MSTSRFVHLHVHTEFSLADSTIRVPAKPEQADPKKAKQANLLYALEWWVFGGFAVYVWSRWCRDELVRDAGVPSTT